MGPDTKIDCAGEDQQEFFRPTDLLFLRVYSLPRECVY
jgi:hypothetical protein